MAKLSVLDLSPIVEGGNARQSLQNSRDLAAHAERCDYHRYWLAEHHNVAGIASAATAVAICYAAAGTSRIRVGAGGVMLPNHAPLVIAEQFGTLASIFPDRVDLGVGRAPGTDPLTSRALRRNLSGGVEDFPGDVIELIDYFGPAEPGRMVRAIPGEGLAVPIWILGSSLYGAQLAAAFGLPFAFASHFAPAQMEQAAALYRDRFKPSAHLAEPYLMLGLNVFAADTDEEAERLFSSLQQAFINRRTGNSGPLPPPADGFRDRLAPAALALLDEGLACSVVGSQETVKRGVAAFLARTQADEIIATAQIYDHRARLKSFEILAAAHRELTRTAE